MSRQEQILRTLEEQMAEIFEFGGPSFEILEDYRALADARLSVFRGEIDGILLWAMVVEAVRYDGKSDVFELSAWLYGNCLAAPREEAIDFTRALFDAPAQWNHEIEPGEVWGLAREQFSIRRHGQRLDFSPSLEELREAGVELSVGERESGQLTPIQMLRYLCHKLEHPFFASEDTLRDLLDERAMEFRPDFAAGGWEWHTPLGRLSLHPYPRFALRLFLQTRDWRHPRSEDYSNLGSPDPAIPVSEAFAPLAAALDKGDLAPWNAQDPDRFNSHWSHWTQTDFQHEQPLQGVRTALGEEGRRFRKLLETFPDGERESTLREIRESWEERSLTVQETTLLSISIIEIAGQHFTLGPHLWEDEDDGQGDTLASAD